MHPPPVKGKTNKLAGQGLATNRLFLRLILVVLLAGILCPFPQQRVEGKAPDTVAVRLKWEHQAEFAGFYCAEQRGLYTREGIRTVLVPGGPDITPDERIEELVRGEVSFTMLDAAQVIRARMQGKPVVAIAAVFQRNPVIYATMKGWGIERLQDLNDKSIMVPEELRLQHDLLVRRLGLNPESIEIVPHVQDTAPLASREVDAHLMYRTGMALDFEQQGYQLNRLWLEEYGVRIYADVIVTTDEVIRKDPALVERFLRATLEGWRYAIENQEEAVEVTLSYDARLAREKQERMMQAQVPLIHTGSEPLGMMSAEKWQQTGRLYVGQLGTSTFSQLPDLDNAYTLDFLERIYPKEKRGQP